MDELARRTKTNTTALFRLLRALESTGIFTQTSPRVFGNTPTSECLRKNVPGSQWPLVLQNLLVVIRAGSLAEAEAVAAADPMHASGARSYRVRPWLVNEGTLTVTLDFATGRFGLT